MKVKYDKEQYRPRPIENIRHMIYSSVELYRDNPAFLVKEKKGDPYKEITYKLLKWDMEALGLWMIQNGLKGEKVAILGENCYEWIVTYLAVVNGVGVAVPLDKELQKEEVENLVKKADCKAIFYTDHYKGHVEGLDIKWKVEMSVYGDRTAWGESLPLPSPETAFSWKNVVALGEAEVHKGCRDYLDQEIDTSAMCVLLFTSGTTGNPKGVMLSHRNITSNLMDAKSLAIIRENDRSLSVLPIHHTLESTVGMLFMLYNGASAAFCEGLKYVTKNMQESGVTILLAVPLIVEAIYSKIWKQAEKSGKARLLKKMIEGNNKIKAFHLDTSKILFRSIHKTLGGKLRLIVTGAAPIDPAVLRGLMDFGFNVLQGYGLTETSPLVSATPEYGPVYRKSGSCGPVLPSGEMRIINKDDQQIGEIIFKGPNVMMGYYNEPDLTAEVIDEDGWFHTGDLGFMDSDGWLYVTGRKKNVIVTKTGKNIYPEELELIVCKSKYISECMVYGVDTDEDTIVTVQVRPDEEVLREEFGDNYTDTEIAKLIKNEIKEINQQMSSYKRIKSVIIRKEEFIKTTTKKIQRMKNR